MKTEYKTIKIESKIASKVKKYAKKKGMTICFYVSYNLDKALKNDIAVDLVGNAPKD